MTKWVKAVAVAIAAAGAILLAYALLTPEPSAADDRMGMWDSHMSYSSGNVGLMALALVAIVVSVMVMALWQQYEPLPSRLGIYRNPLASRRKRLRPPLRSLSIRPQRRRRGTTTSCLGC